MRPSDEEAERLQRKYREQRRRWAWKIGRPYSEDLDKPEPGVFDLADDEAG